VSADAEAVDLLAAGRLAGAVLGELPERCRPRDETAAYRIQDLLHARLEAAGHGRIAGHKIGCTTPVMQAFLGIPNPCAGGVFARMRHDRAARFRHAHFRHVGVECEIAVILGADLARGAQDRGTVAEAVAAVMAAIEVVDDRYDDYHAISTPTLIADDFFNAGCVLGPPVADWRGFDLAALEGRMTINGAEVGRGRGGDILGHPFEALAWLANTRGPLRAGAFVLLGSVVETKWVAPGDEVAVEIESLGGATARFA
jgi:2-keto-4-pentenoate hydratase